MEEVIILRGVSGCGKSTLSDKFSSLGYYIVSADTFFITKDYKYEFDASKLQEAHTQCFDEFRHLLELGVNIVVDNTNTSVREIQKYIDYAEQRGYRVTSLVVENRHGNNSVHNVPEEKRKQQAERLKNSIKLT